MYLQGMPPILPAPSKGAKGGGAKITLPQLAGPLPGMPPNLPAPQRSARPIQLPQTRPSAGGSDAATSGPNYGATQANAFKQSPAYRQAILDVFQHQPAAQRIAIVNGAQRTPSLEGNLILQALHGGPLDLNGKPGAGLTQYTRQGKGPSLLSDLGGLGKSVLRADFGTPGGKGATGTASVLFGGQKGAKQLLGNAGKDIVNLPAETFSTLGTLGGDVLQHNFGKLASDALGGFKQTLADPSKAFYQHPVDTALQAASVIDPASAVGGAAIRRLAPDSALAKAIGPKYEIPPSVHLTGNLTHERPALSPYPTVRAGQKLASKALYENSPAGVLVPRTAGLRERLLRQEVSRGLVGARERIRRAGVDAQTAAHAQTVLAPRLGKIAHGVKTALTYNPGSALIPGANVLARIADHTFRTPATFFDHPASNGDIITGDLAKHMAKVAATRPDLLEFPKALAEHDKYIKEMQAALNDKALRNPKNLNRLFDAAHTYANDVKPLQAEAFAHGHYGPDMTQEGLLRRELQPVVMSHMPGARLDPQLGMVRDVAQPGNSARAAELIDLAKRMEANAARQRESGRFQFGSGNEKMLDRQALDLRRQAAEAQKSGLRSEPISTAEMAAFDKAQTGGRPLAYTSHAEPKGDSAFYTSQQAYPRRAVEKNTGFAYTHGLSDPTHEALLTHRATLENAINAHRSMDKILTSTVLGHPDGGFWKTQKEAQRDARVKGGKYSVIQVGRMTAKDRTGAPTPDNLGNEAAVHSLDLNARLQPSNEPGKFGLIDNIVKDQLMQHQNQISPNTFLRAARASTSQFRRVALGTSVRHLPGVAQEGLIRDIGAGVGVRSALSGKNVFSELQNLDPRTGAETAAGVPREHAAARFARDRKTELTGGTVGGMTRAMETRQGSRYFSGTMLGPPMRAVETLMKTPGPRQLGNAWNAWQHFVINGSKKYLESTQQTAGVGQALLKESGKLMWLQGKAARDAAHGLLSDQTVRQLTAQVRRTYGTWGDLTPSGQMLLMFSPFGMWWVNSVKWLARMPVDQPIKTGVLASATVGTQGQRQAEGLDMFSPGRLSDYLQGSIPAGSKLIASQYYSPFGVANDPAGTIASLTEPTMMPTVLALLGNNYLGHPLTSPDNPKGYKPASNGTKALVALNSVLSNFLPLYTKIQTAAQGGVSAFDTSTAWAPQTKKPNPGIAQGLLKDIQPLRMYPNPGASATGKSSDPLGGGSPNVDPLAGYSNVDPLK